MLHILLIIVFIVIILYSSSKKDDKTKEKKGEEGEREVINVIGDTIEGEQYVLNNIILENNGKTSQIDHIVINSKGIFVIETKNYSGKVYGFENQHEWTQYVGNIESKIYNPIKQNLTHVYNVKKVVGKMLVHSYVVFVQNNTEHIIAKNVIPLSVLKNILEYGDDVLSIEEMRYAYEELLLSDAGISSEEHILNVKAQQYNLKHGICPRCGAQLVLRNGKHGEFWGCSNYSKCNFIKKD